MLKFHIWSRPLFGIPIISYFLFVSSFQHKYYTIVVLYYNVTSNWSIFFSIFKERIWVTLWWWVRATHVKGSHIFIVWKRLFESRRSFCIFVNNNSFYTFLNQLITKNHKFITKHIRQTYQYYINEWF